MLPDAKMSSGRSVTTEQEALGLIPSSYKTFYGLSIWIFPSGISQLQSRSLNLCPVDGNNRRNMGVTVRHGQRYPTGITRDFKLCKNFRSKKNRML